MTVRAGHEDALALVDDALEDYRAILNAGVTNGTLLGRDEFPAFAALASLAAVVDRQDDCLRRLSEWDMLSPGATADAAYWQSEIAKARA